MKKLFIKCNDKSRATYTMKNFVDHTEYVNKYINKSYVKSIILQQYPKKDNEPIIYK
ncbi:amino acid transporter [Clostridium botulinum]|nr:amino acid transporter [Clostridium botulinum]